MGELLHARVDTTAVRAIADQFEDAADLIEQAGRTRVVFDGASAGRAHTAHGDEFRRALEMLLTDVTLWSRAAGEIAVALRTGADRYRGADLSAAAGIS